LLALGLDVGGTASRALVTTVDGARVGFGRAGAGNPFTVALSTALEAVSAAVRSALSDVDPSSIGAVVIGLAGSGKPFVSNAFADAFAWLGITAPVRIVGDVVVAFAAGTAAPQGTVLISGTGAIAARIVDDTLVRSADGLGWLLGDLGSGFWLGRAAAAHAARELSCGPSGILTSLVLAEIPAENSDAFVAAAHSQPPRELARLAPLVTEAALAGDKAALSMVDEAAAHLAASVDEVHAGGPIVLAGSVLRESAPVREAVVRRLPGADVCLADAGEVGAARLAARSL
jgi:glucosamine kinase